MDFVRLEALAGALMKERKAHREREAGSIYEHGLRVSRAVVRLRERVAPGDETHDELLRCAGLFHDVGKGIEPHARYGAVIAREALRDELDEGALSEVCRLIAAHCDRRPDEPVHDVWARLLQDADLIDHIGCYGIWMHIQYSAHTDGGFSAASDYMRDQTKKNLAHHRATLNFDASRAIFDDKAAFELRFAERIQIESEGGYAV